MKVTKIRKGDYVQRDGIIGEVKIIGGNFAFVYWFCPYEVANKIDNGKISCWIDELEIYDFDSHRDNKCGKCNDRFECYTTNYYVE